MFENLKILAISVGFVATLFFLCRTRWINRLARKYTNQIQLISSVVSILGIISIVMGVFTLGREYTVRKENREIYIDNAILEIERNLKFMEILQEQDGLYKDWKKGNHYPSGEFRYEFLSRCMELHLTSEAKTILISSIEDMAIANSFIQLLTRNVSPVDWSKNAQRKFWGFKIGNINQLGEHRKRIAPKLGYLRRELEKQKNG